MLTAEPTTQVETTAVEAAVCPLVIVSPSVNLVETLSVPDVLYFNFGSIIYAAIFAPVATSFFKMGFS